MEYNFSEHYHKILSHLIVAGLGTTETLAHSLVTSRILTEDDFHRVKGQNSVKGKAEIILKSVITEQHAATFKQCLEDCAPDIVKNIHTLRPYKSRSSLRSEDIGEVDADHLLEVISCERDLLSKDFKAMSNKFDQVSEQLAQSQTESAGLMRESASDQQELAMLRRKSLIGGGGNSILNKMYETMLEKYEDLKLTHEKLQEKHSEESQTRIDIKQQLDVYATELSDTRYKYNSIVTDHEIFCRQFQALNERNEILQRDLHRVREERTLIKREYALVMSERDAVHKEIQKLTDDICAVNRQLAESVADKKMILDEKERLLVQLNALKQNQGSEQSTNATSLLALRDELFVAQRERKQALSQYESQLHEAYMARKAQELADNNVIKLRIENEALAAKIESLTVELRDANTEAKDATRNRDMAFSEREKMRCERDEIKKTYDQLAEERERIMKQLEAEMKEHDLTKETKKRIMKELRELRAGTKGPISTAGSRHDNTDSHDSAIDAGEWGSEEICTLEGGGVSRRLRTFQCKLPRLPDINLETGLVVTRSACRGITIGDRVVSINETVVDSNNAPGLQRLIPNSANPCVIKIMRSSSPPPNGSLNGEFGPSSVDSALCAGRQNTINKGTATADAECQTSQILRPMRTNCLHSLENSIDDGTNEDTITPMVERNIHHATTQSMACVSSGGEYHHSTLTYSDSTLSTQAHGIPRQPSNKSSDSSISFHRSSSSRREKKKTKAKFWQKMKKPKSQSGGGAHNKNSSGGTWPRLESPPLASFGGRLSVFTKKRSRPTLSPTTFNPPMDSAGRTPPTMVRGITTPLSSADATPRSFQDIHPGSPTSSQPLRPPPAMKKRPRPVSVPIDSGQPLTLWTENISNNNNSLSPRRPTTPKSPTLQEIFLESATVASEPLPSHRSLSSHGSSLGSSNQSAKLLNQLVPENRLTMNSVQPTVTGQPITRPHTIFFEKPDFIRQQSVPPNSTSEKIAAIPELFSPRQAFRHIQRSRPLISPPTDHPRSVRSLPRPTSAKTTSSRTSSHQSIEASIKTKSLDYRRIRIPSEHSVGMKLSGSEKGSISLSSERSTPTLFHHHHHHHNNRSHSPATPLQSVYHSATLMFRPSSSLLSPSIAGTSFSAMPLFHPSSTPLIPSPVTPSIQPTTPHILDSSVPIIPGSAVSSLSNISAMSTRGRRPTVTTDPRYVCMIKGTDPIGISIVGGGEKGGIFVSRITEDSLAARAGLEYGDQLLEYNGINLRCANEEQGRAIMSQTQPGDNITFLAQYNLEKYKSSIETNLSDSLGLVKVPKHRGSMLRPCDDNEGTITPDTTPRSSPHVDDTHRAQPIGQPRFLLTNGCEHVKIVGGNNSGIFVASIGEEMSNDGDLKIGDQVLECNGNDLRSATLERASLLFLKSSINTSLRVYFNSVGYSKLSTEPGDLFYVRALFDNIVEASTGSLPFSKNSILLVDNTYPDHMMGSWSAWLVDEHGEKTTHGKIPSKFIVEKESGIHRDFDDAISCAGSTAGKKLGGTGRRSFFKRRKPHRTSSRSSGDVKLHKSISETSIESTETSFEHHMGAAYQVVEKHVCVHRRPVVVFGPHASAVCDRLTKEYGSSFARCTLDALHNSADINDKNVIETYKQVASTLALRVETLEREMQKHRHVLLEISQDAVDRLHSHKIYPIIVFIEYTSAKKVKDSQDRVPGRDKISIKQSKDIFERANSVRKKLSIKYLGTVYIHGGSSVTVGKQIHTVVEREQSKILWLPTSHDLLSY